MSLFLKGRKRLAEVPKPSHGRFKKKKKRSRDAQMACIDRDGMCMVCGQMRRELLVGHHIDSWGSSGNDSVENMITLCGRCHDNAGNGYIDYSAVNPPMRKYINPPKGYMIGYGSVSKSIPKVYNVDVVFKVILEGEYGYTY